MIAELRVAMESDKEKHAATKSSSMETALVSTTELAQLAAAVRSVRMRAEGMEAAFVFSRDTMCWCKEPCDKCGQENVSVEFFDKCYDVVSALRSTFSEQGLLAKEEDVLEEAKRRVRFAPAVGGSGAVFVPAVVPMGFIGVDHVAKASRGDFDISEAGWTMGICAGSNCGKSFLMCGIARSMVEAGLVGEVIVLTENTISAPRAYGELQPLLGDKLMLSEWEEEILGKILYTQQNRIDSGRKQPIMVILDDVGDIVRFLFAHPLLRPITNLPNPVYAAKQRDAEQTISPIAPLLHLLVCVLAGLYPLVFANAAPQRPLCCVYQAVRGLAQASVR